jgi:hypothetical protein
MCTDLRRARLVTREPLADVVRLQCREIDPLPAYVIGLDGAPAMSISREL